MTIADLGEFELGYTDEGSGDVLVLLHGFPLNRTMWKHQISEFAKTHRVIAPDLRGHGESSVTSGTVTMSNMANDVTQLLDHLNVDQPISLGGLSMGGYVAWEFWLQFPQRLRHLLLFDTRAVADTETVARARQMMAAQVVSAGASMAADAMLPKFVSPSTKENKSPLVDSVNAMILATDPEAIAATQRGMAERRDMTELLPRITTPTLVVCGEHDEISPVREMQGFAQVMPHAQFVEIAAAGHLAPLEQPAAVNMAVRNFLAN